MDEQYTVAGILRPHAAERPDDHAGRRGRPPDLGRAAPAERPGVGGAGRRGGGPRRPGGVPGPQRASPTSTSCSGRADGCGERGGQLAAGPAEVAAVVDDAEAAVFVVHADYLADWPPRPAAAVGPPDRGRRAGRSRARRRTLAGSPTRRGWPAGAARTPATASARRAQPDALHLGHHRSGQGGHADQPQPGHACGAASRAFDISEDTVSLVAMPLFHIGGCGWAVCAMSRGGRSVILRDVDPVEFLSLVETEAVTATFVVPAVLMFLLHDPGRGHHRFVQPGDHLLRGLAHRRGPARDVPGGLRLPVGPALRPDRDDRCVHAP